MPAQATQNLTPHIKPHVLFQQCFTIFSSIMEKLLCYVLFGLRLGIQNLQREFPEKVPAHQTAAVPRLLHQKIHQEQLLCGKEPNYCQFPHHVRTRLSED